MSATPPGGKSTRVLVEGIDVAEDGALILVRVRGSHFLWKMVRRMVGVMAAAGRGELDAQAAASWLASDHGQDSGVTPAALTAPAAGLFLEGVYYDGDSGPGPLVPVLRIE